MKNDRSKTLGILIAAAAFLLAVGILGAAFAETAQLTDFSAKNLPPSAAHLFGTDWMGRDMLARTLSGLSISIRIGLLAAVFSGVISLLLGSAAALGGRAADGAVGWLTDLMMGVPHIILLILIAFACGRGAVGVVLGITFTHWMQLARVVRGEAMQVRASGFVLVAEKLGASRAAIAGRHVLPHVLPQFGIGLVLMFPHAIMHEAAITFLGFGLPPEMPSIGIILSESIRYLSAGEWWLAVLPGAMLVAVVLLFDRVGAALRALSDPASANAYTNPI